MKNHVFPPVLQQKIISICSKKEGKEGGGGGREGGGSESNQVSSSNPPLFVGNVEAGEKAEHQKKAIRRCSAGKLTRCIQHVHSIL